MLQCPTQWHAADGDSGGEAAQSVYVCAWPELQCIVVALHVFLKGVQCTCSATQSWATNSRTLWMRRILCQDVCFPSFSKHIWASSTAKNVIYKLILVICYSFSRLLSCWCVISCWFWGQISGMCSNKGQVLQGRGQRGPLVLRAFIRPHHLNFTAFSKISAPCADWPRASDLQCDG